MKQPYKIQNRTSESHRVKFVKNGGTVSFPKTPTASFVENSREAGFCLTAITPLPLRDSATDKITLTSHPMGTDGRVSLYINGTLIESKRFLNKARIADRQAWFNSEFGAYVTYSGKELATFKTAIVSPDVYRFVFEDDDLDYIFADTTNAAGDLNPTLIVEQYRLAFNIMNNKIEINDGSLGQSEISCDGAYDTIGIQGNLDYSTGWTIYLNGQDYGRATDETPLEYRSDWEFDFKIQVYSSEGNILRITNTSDGDLRIKLKPDVVLPNMSMTFIDDDLDYQERPSENVTVMDDGSINVCLRNGSAGSSSGPK